jgi:AAA family ATP:ADP antiporter
MLFLNWVNTTGEYILGRTVTHKAEQEATAPAKQEIWEKEYEEALAAGSVAEGAEEEFLKDKQSDFKKSYIGRFYANFYSVVNLATLLIQLFVVSRIIKYLGIRIALLILPIIAFAGYTILVFIPVLSIVRWAKTAENSTDYSLQNTVRHALFLPVTREEKYQAKQATDTLFVRLGDVLSAVLVFIGTSVLVFGTQHFALVNMILVLVWIVLAILIGLENRKLSAAVEEEARTE